MSPNDIRAPANRDTASREIWQRLAAGDRPLFWLIASGVFLGNSVLSAVHGAWILGGLQAVTGLLALISAATVAKSRHQGAEHARSDLQASRYTSEASPEGPDR
jgi:hypothetical protein